MEHAPLIAQSIARIRAYRSFRGWKLNRLAKEAGLRESSIRFMDQDDWNPESKTLHSLESVIPVGFDPTKPDGGLPAEGEAA